MDRSKHACVIGAGIVGAASAYALAQDGWRVTLVDDRTAPGEGVSKANGAQLSYSYVEPLATPSALQSLPSWLLASWRGDADSPLRWRPRIDFDHWRWLVSFVQACRDSAVRQTTSDLLGLSFLSRDTLHEWMNAFSPEVRASLNFSSTGKLVIYRKSEARAHVEQQLKWQAELGCEQRIISADECRRIEPALAATGGGTIQFGVWTPSEEAIDACALAQALVQAGVQAGGVTLRSGCKVRSLSHQGHRVTAAHLDDGSVLEADHFVIAAGPQSVALVRPLRPLGIDLPIEPIKGYSITLPIVNDSAAPRVSITDTGRKTVHARLGNSLRVAGFAELCGPDTTIDERRIDSLCKTVNATFPGACDLTQRNPWTGLRPATPSGRPIIGATPVSNLWLNVGHGSLGLTLSAGSARTLAWAMRQEDLSRVARPFTYR